MLLSDCHTCTCIYIILSTQKQTHRDYIQSHTHSTHTTHTTLNTYYASLSLSPFLCLLRACFPLSLSRSGKASVFLSTVRAGPAKILVLWQTSTHICWVNSSGMGFSLRSCRPEFMLITLFCVILESWHTDTPSFSGPVFMKRISAFLCHCHPLCILTKSISSFSRWSMHPSKKKGDIWEDNVFIAIVVE